jgi:hypothetical protein
LSLFQKKKFENFGEFIRVEVEGRWEGNQKKKKKKKKIKNVVPSRLFSKQPKAIFSMDNS